MGRAQRRHHHLLMLLLIRRLVGRPRVSTGRPTASGSPMWNVQQIRVERAVGILLHLTSVQHHQVPRQSFRDSTAIVPLARNVRARTLNQPHVLLMLLLLLLLVVAQLELHLHVLLGVNVRLRDCVIAVGRGILQRRVLIHFNVQ